MALEFAHYARHLLCSKLCRHNRRVPICFPPVVENDKQHVLTYSVHDGGVIVF